MRQALVRLIRQAGLLRPADEARFWWRRLRALGANRRFAHEHPGFAAPPADLLFDALNSVRLDSYLDQGRRHAAVFARLLLERSGARPLDVLEWGCGPGRLIRHMSALLAERDARLTGADFNPRSIEWCRANLPGIDFVGNGLLPPLPLPDARFDASFCFSVLTHLSERAQLAWTAELRRVLKPGGLLVLTTHGAAYRRLLGAAVERRRFDDGRVVVQASYPEGRKLFLAVQPERWVRNELLRGFEQIVLEPASGEADLIQDVWTARKPGPAA